MRGQLIVAATTIVRRGGILSHARINTPLGKIDYKSSKVKNIFVFFSDGRFLTNQRGLVTSIARLGDGDKVIQSSTRSAEQVLFKMLVCI